MAQRDDIARLDLAALRIVHYPDPRLQQPAKTVETGYESPARFRRESDTDTPARPVHNVGHLGPLVERMFEVMAAAGGVGLAATQLGVPLRVFVACPTGDPADRRAYVNPTLLELDGQMEDEEGCLSVPGVTSHIKRFGRVTLEATDLAGQRFRQTGEGLLARIFQHETDHLDGRLIVDRMGSLARLAHRHALKDLRDRFAEEH